jgi:hypothetical protein
MAFAGGVNLSWTDCGVTGAGSRTSACLTNASAGTLVASAIAPYPLNSLNGQTGVIDLETSTASLDPWWTSSCTGRTPFSCSMDFTTASGACLDPWAGAASPGISYAPGFGGANRGRIKGTGAIAGIFGMDDVSETYIFKIQISGVKTTGTGACLGCLDGAVFVLNDQLLTQPLGSPGGDVHLNSPINSQCVTWQASGPNIPGGCPGATATKNSTWGSVKALYR